MKKLILISTISVLIIAAYFLLIKDFHHEKETIFYNGTILTLEDSLPKAQAVFVKKGIISAVGKTDEIMKLKGADTVLVDLSGKTMMPGFIDPHTHVDISAFLFDMVDLSGFRHKTNKEVWDHLEKEVKKYSKGEWIVCKGLDPILTSDLKTPHISYMDKIAPDNPLVIISQTIHSYWANTKAFEASGVRANTPDPSKSSFYEKDKEGRLTGFIAEQAAFNPIRLAMLKAAPTKKLIRKMELTLKDYAKKGNTTVVSAGLTTNDKIIVRLYEHLSSEKPSLLSQALSFIGLFPERSQLPRHFIYHRQDMENLLPPEHDNGDDSFKILGVKLWYDGSPYTGSMYLEKPYMNSELARKELHIHQGDRGNSLITKNDLAGYIKKYNAAKWQISVHTQGDSANSETLEVFSDINKTMDVTPYRHRIEHCLLLDRNLIPEMKKLNITPSFHINHIYYYGKALNDSIIGPERAEKVLPVKSTADNKMNYTLHADQPMFESNPFSLIYTAVTRKTREGITLGANEGISVLEAVKALTTMSAWQIGFENKLGSIKTGKYADFVILDRNPFEIPVEKIRETRILKTIINGNNVNF